MSRKHHWIAGDIDGRFAILGERVPGGVGNYVVATDDETQALRANTPEDLMRKLGVQYRRFRPLLIQIDSEIISQTDWPSASEVWDGVDDED